MRNLLIFLGCISFFSCKDSNENVLLFRTGTFNTFLDDKEITSTAVRNDTLQIETYNQKKDTFAITWNSNFEYELLKLNPKNELDSTPFVVKITGIKNKSYTFTAHYKGSNFKQKGKAVKTD